MTTRTLSSTHPPSPSPRASDGVATGTSGRRVVAVLFLTMLGAFTLIAVSLMLQQPKGNIDTLFLRTGRFHGAWIHAGDPDQLETWNIESTDVLFLVDGVEEVGTADPPALTEPVIGTLVIDGRRARFELDTESDAAGGTLLFEAPEPGIVALGALENRILIDLDASPNPMEDTLYLGFGRGKWAQVVKMLSFRRVP